jgi:tetratricopeptide (TPR) repeat protein
MLCGTARRRMVAGEAVHLLHLDGLVRHAPVPVAVSERLSGEIGAAIPRRLRIPVDGDALAFETTAHWMSIGGRYIIAEAAFLSGDPILAEELYLDAEEQLRQARELEKVLEPIAAALPSKITRLYTVWLEAAYNNYFISRDKQVLCIVDTLSGKLLKRDPTNYGALLAVGICEFVLRHDLEKALMYINNCEGNKDSTWRISRAFLFAYKGDLLAAHDDYREARRRGISNSNVPLQSEEFINIVLGEEPGKEQLHFCLGLINYNLKQDYEAALTDFERFLASPSAAGHLEAKQLAERLKSRCEAQRKVRESVEGGSQ